MRTVSGTQLDMYVLPSLYYVAFLPTYTFPLLGDAEADIRDLHALVMAEARSAPMSSGTILVDRPAHSGNARLDIPYLIFELQLLV